MIKIIDYKAGNAPSVLSAIEHLGYRAELTDKPRELENASLIILPGVGTAKATIASLGELGMINAIQMEVLRKKTMFLGICVGLQILFKHSEEENTNCLGWFEGVVKKFDDNAVKVPQMGWNNVKFTNCVHDGYYYFVNSYYALPEDESIIWGKTDYNGHFASAIQKDNIYATQFHIEKSGKAGLSLLNEIICRTKGGS